MTVQPSTPLSPSPPERRVPTLEHFEGQVRDLSGQWIPRAPELNDFLERWERAWNSHSLDDLERLVTEDIAWEDPAMYGDTVTSRAEFRAFNEIFFKAFPDVQLRGVGEPYLALDGAGVALAWRITGTFTGELALWGKQFGPEPPVIAPTGRAFDLQGVDLYGFREHLLDKWLIVYDLTAFSRQLGLL